MHAMHAAHAVHADGSEDGEKATEEHKTTPHASSQAKQPAAAITTRT